MSWMWCLIAGALANTDGPVPERVMSPEGIEVRATRTQGQVVIEVDVPPGLPPAYWLEGVVRLEARTSSNVDEVRVQACTANTCYPPELMPWVVRP